MARTEPTTDRLRTCKESDDVFTDVVQPEMRKIAVEVLQAARDSIEHRKNSWELYGYDFMVDAELRPWLIEVNSSPACDYSTAVTERYVKKALVDILKVTIDKREWERTPVGDAPDTGGWQLAHKGPFVETPIASLSRCCLSFGDEPQRSCCAAPASGSHRMDSNGAVVSATRMASCAVVRWSWHASGDAAQMDADGQV